VKDVSELDAPIRTPTATEATAVDLAACSCPHQPSDQPTEVVRGFLRRRGGRGDHRTAFTVHAAVGVASFPHCAVDVPAGPRPTLFVSFVPRQRVNQAAPIAHVDHTRTTSIPSNYGTFTNHLHIKA
jgi:hypothetical protein